MVTFPTAMKDTTAHLEHLFLLQLTKSQVEFAQWDNTVQGELQNQLIVLLVHTTPSQECTIQLCTALTVQVATFAQEAEITRSLTKRNVMLVSIVKEEMNHKMIFQLR